MNLNDKYGRAALWLREGRKSVSDALQILDFNPESATSEEIILQGIVYQIQAIESEFIRISTPPKS